MPMHQSDSPRLFGEVFVCVPVAVQQAGTFHTTWQSEIIRYAIHGVLHLLGHRDHSPSARRRMKTAEQRWLRWLERHKPGNYYRELLEEDLASRPGEWAHYPAERSVREG